MCLDRSWRSRQACCSTTGGDWRRQFPNSGGRRRIPGLSVHCLIRYEAARATRKWEYWRRGWNPNRREGPAANLAKRRVDSPDCQDAGPRNLILHDQPERRGSRIGHQGTHFKMSAGATVHPETQGLPERGLGGSMSWGRGTRVSLARPKALEQGNSKRDREGVTQSRPITESTAGAGWRRTARRKSPQGRPIPKRAIPP